MRRDHEVVREDAVCPHLQSGRQAGGRSRSRTLSDLGDKLFVSEAARRIAVHFLPAPMCLGQSLVFIRENGGKRIQHPRGQLGTICFGELQGESLDFGKCHHNGNRNRKRAGIKGVDAQAEA